MLGTFGDIILTTFTQLGQSDYYPIAEADVALGFPSVQSVGRKLTDFQLTGRYWSSGGLGNTADITTWYQYAESRLAYLLILNDQPQGNYIITAITSTQGRLPNSEQLNVTLKHEGAFLWTGNYQPYNPPPVARKQAEQGISGLLSGLSGWLRK